MTKTKSACPAIEKIIYFILYKATVFYPELPYLKVLLYIKYSNPESAYRGLANLFSELFCQARPKVCRRGIPTNTCNFHQGKIFQNK